MANFAEIDENGIVIRVLVTDNNDPLGDEGYQWLIDNLGGTWIKTSYNARENGFRKHYADVGMKYDEDLDAFIPQKPFISWILDEDSVTWKAPVEIPEDYLEINYYWDEDSVSWAIVPE